MVCRSRTGFTKDIARALVNPAKVLPDVRSRGDWFDKVIAYMNREGYWICRHPLGTNVVYIEGLDSDGRVNDDRPNVFNDLRVVFDDRRVGAARSWRAGRRRPSPALSGR